MKNSIIIILFAAFLSSFFMIYASTISYNKDGSITQTDSSGKKTTVNMDGKTPEGETIPDVVKKIKSRNTELEIIYSGAMSDMALSFYKDDGYIRKFYNSLVKISDSRLSEKKFAAENIKIIISNCRIGKTGYCGRMNRSDVKLSIYRDGKAIDEIILQHSNILGRNNSTAAAKVCSDRIFSRL